MCVCVCVLYGCVCIQHFLEQSLRLPRKTKSTTSKRNLEHPHVPAQETLFFPFLQHYALSLARFEAKD